MPNFASAIATYLASLFTAPAGSDIQIDSVSQSIALVPPVSTASVTVGNAPPELLEQGTAVRYPTFAIYCDKLTNNLTEKFRTFSGVAHVVVEIRHSSNQIQNMQPALETYTTAVCQILDAARGDWGGGVFYAGGYEVSLGAVKKGGQNFLQTAKVGADIDVSY